MAAALCPSVAPERAPLAVSAYAPALVPRAPPSSFWRAPRAVPVSFPMASASSTNFPSFMVPRPRLTMTNAFPASCMDSASSSPCVAACLDRIPLPASPEVMTVFILSMKPISLNFPVAVATSFAISSPRISVMARSISTESSNRKFILAMPEVISLMAL